LSEDPYDGTCPKHGSWHSYQTDKCPYCIEDNYMKEYQTLKDETKTISATTQSPMGDTSLEIPPNYHIIETPDQCKYCKYYNGRGNCGHKKHPSNNIEANGVCDDYG